MLWQNLVSRRMPDKLPDAQAQLCRLDFACASAAAACGTLRTGWHLLQEPSLPGLDTDGSTWVRDLLTQEPQPEALMFPLVWWEDGRRARQTQAIERELASRLYFTAHSGSVCISSHCRPRQGKLHLVNIAPGDMPHWRVQYCIKCNRSWCWLNAAGCGA